MTETATSRSVIAVYAATRDDIGDLVTRRPIPNRQVQQISPFLFLNHHGPQAYAPGNQGLPFGPHPHRGFETVTFILKGSLSHLDTGGHESVIHEGGVQWMTAGSGLVHAELSPEAFMRDGGPLELLQLWVNLPARLKMTEPQYTGLQKGDIPKLTLSEGVSAELISGRMSGQTGPFESLTGIMMSVVRAGAGAEVSLAAPEGRSVFFYVIEGGLTFDGQAVAEHRLVHFDDGADRISFKATRDTVILFGHAEPIKEPVVSHGPFVMNTADEIRQAIVDYNAGKFGSF